MFEVFTFYVLNQSIKKHKNHRTQQHRESSQNEKCLDTYKNVNLVSSILSVFSDNPQSRL